MGGMTRRDQALIAFMVAAFCLVAAVAGVIRGDPPLILGAGVLAFLGVTCIIAGVSLLRPPPA